MIKRIGTVLAALAFLLLVLNAIVGARGRAGYTPEDFVEAAAIYDAEIIRDKWGVPHIHGARDADVAFGLAYAHAQDDITNIESVLPLYRGESAQFQGRDALPVDYLVQWLGARDAAIAGYETELSPAVRSVIEGYAAGINYYAARHPDDVDQRLYPVTAIDLVTAYSVQHLFFYGFQRSVKSVFDNSGEFAEAPADLAMRLLGDDVPIGSNAIAVAPSRSTDGATRLLGNSHQPLTGPLAWYEVHVDSDEGWKMRGGLFPGSPMINVGATPNLGWGVTVNQPDLVDVYSLAVDPQDDGRYRMDGEWLRFGKREAKLKIGLIGNLYWTVTRDIFDAAQGPALVTEHGTFAFRFAGQGEIRQPEQWYRMNRARNLEEWRAAMDLGAIASFNFVYADAEGHIGIVHNSRSPVRARGWNWKAWLPGDRSDLIWSETQDFADNPQVFDPRAGYVHSANQSPFFVTDPAENPNPANFAPEFGYPTRMTNRADRGLELLAADTAIDRAEFEAIKFDHHYAKNSRAANYVRSVQGESFINDPQLSAAQQVLANWNFSAGVDNEQAALGVCVLSKEWVAEQARETPPPVREAFIDCVELMQQRLGRLEIPWGEVNRLRQGEVDLPVNGGPDTLRAIYATDPDEDGVLRAVGGDGLIVMAEWDAQGTPLIRTVHQYGSASTRPGSPHYSDQAQMFAQERLKDVEFDLVKVRAQAESITRVPARN